MTQDPRTLPPRTSPMIQKGDRVPQEQLHPVLEEGNRTPTQLVKVLESFAAREPKPMRGRRLALGLTVLREVDGKAHMRWMQLLRSHWWPGPIYNGKGQYTVMARNNVLRQAFDELDSWDDLLFWDADQIPPLIIPALPAIGWEGGWFTDYLDFISATQTDKPVIAGLYFSREDYWQTDEIGKVKAGPHEPVAYKRTGQASYGFLTPQDLLPMLQQRGMYRVGGVGTGSMLIRKEPLLQLAELKLPDAVFDAPRLKPGDHGGGPGSQWTEDLFFCHEIATRLGGDIWLDSAMESAHVAEIWITSAHYLASRGYGAEPHPQSFRAVNTTREDERRKSRIVLPK